MTRHGTGDRAQETKQNTVSRRTLLQVGAVTGGTFVAGCLDGDDDDDRFDADPDEFEEFDPAAPELPQLASTLIEEDWQYGNVDELDEMDEQEEPAHGALPPEADGDYIDPDPLIIAWEPTEDPGGYEDTYDLLEEVIADEVDRDVEVFVVDDAAAQVEAMRAERLHVGRFSTGNTPFAVNIAGAVPFAMPVAEGDLFGTKSWLITASGNDDINGVSDLEGAEVAFGSAGSNSGTLAPQFHFEEMEGLVAGEDYDYEQTGGHEQSTLGVHQGDFDAGTVCSHCFERAAEARDLDLSNFKVVWSTDADPLGPFSYRYDLDPDIVEAVERALYDTDFTDTALHDDQEYVRFTEIDYATHWHNVLQVQEANEIEYEEEEV